MEYSPNMDEGLKQIFMEFVAKAEEYTGHKVANFSVNFAVPIAEEMEPHVHFLGEKKTKKGTIRAFLVHDPRFDPNKYDQSEF